MKIKFYSKYDMTSSHSINNIIEFTNNFEYEKEEYSINDILEYFNIIKFSQYDEFKEIIIEETSEKFEKVLKILQKRIGIFIAKNKSNILNLYKEVYFEYREDFLELIDQYNIYSSIEDLDFEQFLKNDDMHYNIILRYRKIVDRCDKIICKFMIEDNECAEILIKKYIHQEKQSGNEIYLPKSLTQENKEQILLKYLEAENVHPRYLEIIINFPSQSNLKINDRIKLKAKRRHEEERNKMFENSEGKKVGVEISYDENQEDAVIYSSDGSISKCIISTKWIEENLDFNTILNNFIYIFGYFDNNMRLSLVSKSSEIGAMERSLLIEDTKHFYKESFAFRRKEMMSNCQIYSYIHNLEKYEIRIEDVIEWFFKDYLLEEFGIDNYVVKMPTSKSSYLEKCRAITPEIDRILKQYQYYIEDGEIDQELLQMSSSHMFFEKCKSTVDNKYVYNDSDIFNTASYLLFSDQSTISYLPNLKEQYSEFYRLIIMEKVKLSDFNEYQVRDIGWLVENKFICEDRDGYLQFVNINRIFVFLDLYKNGVINYWNYNEVLRDEVDILAEEKIVKFESKLFTNCEEDYFNYHLNKSKFSNSLDLRNKYSHGTQPNGEDLHMNNYFIFLKLVIIIIVKINDDLCIKEILEQ